VSGSGGSADPLAMSATADRNQKITGGAVVLAGTAGSAGSGAWLISQILGKLSGSDWIGVVVILVTTAVIFLAFVLIAVGIGYTIVRTAPAGSGPAAEIPGLIITSGLTIVLVGLVTLAVVVLAGQPTG
jgi:hypothetical protein